MLPARLDYARDFTLARKLAETAAAHIKFAHIPVRATANRATVILSDLKFRFSACLIYQTFSSHDLYSFLTGKGHAQLCQQSLGFLIRPGCGNERNVHATLANDLIIVDLREKELFFEA